MRMPVFRGIKRWGAILAFLVLSSLLLAACDNNTPNMLNPVGPVASQERDLFWFIFAVAAIVFVFVEGWLIVNIVRYRERPNMPQPRQIHGNNTVEIIWTVGPSLFLFFVLVLTIRTMFGLAEPPGSHLEVRAVGHQWWWEFDYPNQHIVTADSLYVPVGTVVQVDLHSDNVIHSFWVPRVTGKTDVIPGHNNIMWFRVDQPGTYRGECAEYCGTQHAHMDFDVVAVSPGAFTVWLSQQQASAATPTTTLAQQGLALFKGSGGCAGCHGIVGVNLKSFDDPLGQSLVGPNLTHFGSRHLIAGGILATSDPTKYDWINDPACQIVNGQLANKNACALYQWLSDPQGIKPGSDMHIPSLSDQQIMQLIAYLQTLH